MKVLLALDGSDRSLIARDLVAGLPWPAAATVHVLTAYHVPTDWTGGVGSTMAWVGDAEDAVRDQLNERLHDWAAPLVAAGLTVAYGVYRGRPADVIANAATELGADLVVMGSRGRGALKSMLLGSVATEVAMHAPCAVLVARAPRITRLLVATDGSPHAGTVPAVLAGLGVFREHPAVVISVEVPEDPAFELMVGLYTLGDDRLAEMRRESSRAAAVGAEEMVRRLAEVGITATAQVRRGAPADEILHAAGEHQADVIVTGSRGLGAMERMLLGSVARNVLIHASCSVLVTRAVPARQASGGAET